MQISNSCAAVVEARFFLGEIAKAVYFSVSAVSIAVVFYAEHRTDPSRRDSERARVH